MCIKFQANLFAGIALFCLQFPAIMLQPTMEFPNIEIQEQYKLVMESINKTIDPCEDFYEYACGNSKMIHGGYMQSSLYEISLSHYMYAVNSISHKLRALLPDGIPAKNQTFAEKLLAFYRSTPYDNETEYFEVLKPGKNVEWPLINRYYGSEKQNFENFDVFEFMGNLFSYGFNNVVMDLNKKRHKNGTLHVDLFVADQTDEEQSLGYLNSLLHNIGFSWKSEEFKVLKTEIQNSHKFWQSAYANYSYDSIEYLTYDQLKNKYSKLATFLENALPNQLQNDDIIAVNQLEYMDFLMNKQWQPVEIKELCNYLMACFHDYIVSQLRPLRPDTMEIRRYMHMAYGFLYYEHFLKSHEQQINKSFDTMVKQIYKQILALVEENNLKFSEEQLTAIKQKLSQVHVSKGNLPDNVNFEMLNKIYSDLPDFREDSFTINLMYLLRHHFLEKINCPRHVECIDEVGPSAGSIVEDDLLIVPFAAFLPPMYHWDLDSLLSISLMGFLIGHEFTHFLDTSALTSEDIYPEYYQDFEKHPQLNEARECMLQQMSSEYIRERVADLMGARAAYQAYAEEYNEKPSYSAIPWQKLFFLNMSEYFCQSRGTVEVAHDASDVRLRQIVMNMNEFAEAFQCPIGSKMNPENKCRYF